MPRDRIDESAAARSRWLAELAEALAQAQDLSWRIGRAIGQSPEAMNLYARIETMRGEVRALQLRSAPERGEESGPNWSNQSPWCPIADSGDHMP